MQQPPNYFGSSYPGNPSMPSGSSYPEQAPYMSSKDYPQPQRATSGNDNPPPSGQKTIDNDPTIQVFPIEGMEEREVTIYATFPDSTKWHDKVFTGYLLIVRNDALVIYDKESKNYISIVSVYINYVESKNKKLIYPY